MLSLVRIITKYSILGLGSLKVLSAIHIYISLIFNLLAFFMTLDIYQLSKLVSKQKVLAIGLFKDNKIDSETKYLFLFENIISDKITNDKEAKKALNYSEDSKAFLKFKERYTKKILDYIMLSDTTVKGGEFINEEYCRLLQLYSVARIIQYKKPSPNAFKLYNYVYHQSKKYEFIDLQLLAALPIRAHHAYQVPDKKKYKDFKKELDFLQKKLNKRLELDKFYDEVSHAHVSTKLDLGEDFKQDLLQESEEFIDRIEEDDTYLYTSKVLELAAYAYTVNEDLEKSIDISKQSVELSKQQDFVPRYKIFLAYKDIISNYLMLGQYDNAQKYLQEILELSTVRSYNFFFLKGLEYSLYANIKDYKNLYLITLDVLDSKTISNFQIHFEQWKIREAYANVLLESGKIDESIMEHAKYKKFRLNKFLNEVEMFSKDKRGINISILVVELMHFLIRKEYDKLLNRLDALNQYTYRYLRNDETLRSNCFIKMLLKLPEAEYHPLRTERYVKKYEKKLRENPLQISLKSIDVEIIPYEDLWDIIIEILGKQSKKKKYA